MPGKPTNEKSLAASSSGTATPVIAKDTSESLATFATAVMKPDKKAYEAEQAKIKTEIDALQAQMVTDIIAGKGILIHLAFRLPSATRSVSQLNLVLGMTEEMLFGLNWIAFVINKPPTNILERDCWIK